PACGAGPPAPCGGRRLRGRASSRPEPLGELCGCYLFVLLSGAPDLGAFGPPLDDCLSAEPASMRELALERAARVVDLGAQTSAAQLGNEGQHPRLVIGFEQRDEDVDSLRLDG